MPVDERICSSEAETMALGEEIGRRLRPGGVVALTGPLGAGKTVFVKGVAKALGIRPDDITSPTFTFVHRHDTSRAGVVYHVDLFRVDSPRELSSVGFDEVIGSGAVVLVEWAEKAASHLPEDSVRVEIDYSSTGRRIRVGTPFAANS